MNASMFLGMKFERLTITLQQACEELEITKGHALNQICAGTFPIPTRIEGKHRVVDVRDLGDYIDRRRAEARAALKGSS